MSRRPPAPDPIRRQGVPRVKLVQKGFHEDATDAMFLASSYRLVPDPWQAEILNAWLSRRPDGKWTHPRCGLSVPRQNGKNGVLEVRELFGLIVLGEAILHTAHEIKTSRKAFLRLMHFFGEKADDPRANFPDLNALVKAVRKTNGQEAIFLKDLWRVDGQLVRSIGRPQGDEVEYVARGGFIEFATRTAGGGRGTTYDLLVIDEAQHLSEEDLQAVRPVISSGPLGNSQIIYLGTPPDPDKLDEKGGEAWVRIRAGAGDPKLAWIEYGAPDGPRPDLEDMDLLYECNPSLGMVRGDGSHGLDFETIDGERKELSPDGYARERLGWWGNPEAKRHRGVIDMDQWRSLRVDGNELPARGLIVVDVAPDLSWTSVALATDGPAGKPLGLVDRHEGTGWVVRWDEKKDRASGRLPQLVADLDKVLEVALTPTAHMFSAALTKAKIEHKKLTTSDVGASCMAVQKMITDNDVAHVAQPTLDIAAKAAITKFVGDTQQWDRRNRKLDISPLVAFSVAVHRWALAVAKPNDVGVPRRTGGSSSATRRAAGAGERRPSSPPTRRAGSTGFDPRSSGF